MLKKRLQVIVVGDEFESCLCAMALGLYGFQVRLLRRSRRGLGGLSTRGGLGYMDITPRYLPPLMQKVLADCGFIRVGLHPQRAMDVLARQLEQAGVTVESGCRVRPVFEVDARGRRTLNYVEDATSNQRFEADFYIDATPDATLARRLGVPALLGLGGVFGHEKLEASLGVSPVFRVSGVSVEALRHAEARLRQSPEAEALLQTHMPWLDAEARRTFIERPTYAPPEEDYLDILNPLIGLAYHQWRYGEGEAYESAPSWIDGFNIARLRDGSLCFNGLIMRQPLAQQLHVSEEERPPCSDMREEMRAFIRFLEGFTDTSGLQLHMPEQVYIRQTFQLQAQQQLSARDLLRGGCDPHERIGTFSYWLDFRGVHPWRYYPEYFPLPKPVFDVGLGPHFPKRESVGLDNLAILSRSAGFSPLGQGACRIVQYQCMIAEALAAALALALPKQAHPLDLEAPAILRQQEGLVARYRLTMPPHDEGHATMNARLAESWLLAADDAIAAELQAAPPNTLLQGSIYKAPYRTTHQG